MQINSIEKLLAKTLAETDLSKKQQAVLNASLSLFTQQGFERTTSSEIAQQAAVSEGTVFKQFKTKQGILNALLEPFIENVFPRALNEFTNEITGQQYHNFEHFLCYVVKNRLTFAMENQKQLKIFLQEIIRDETMVKVMYDKWQVLLDEHITPLFITFQKNKQLIDWPISRIM